VYQIPTIQKWNVLGHDKDGTLVHFDFCDTQEAAESAARLMRFDCPELVVTVTPYDSIVPNRTPPTPEQLQQICWVLHCALVMIRNLGYEEGKQETMREIAEALHETPQEMFHPNVWDWNGTLARLRELEERYPDARTLGLAKRFEKIFRG
jgi:hypothetical protein